MRPCHHVVIETPKGVSLHALLFGPKRPKHLYIVLHGLTGSMFSIRRIVDALITKDAAVLVFDNRGAHMVSTVKQTRGAKSRYITVGSAYERFTDSVDDIDGALRMARMLKATRVYLVGHSTGAQKIVHWASRKGRGVHGLVLLGPLSDYTVTLQKSKRQLYARGIELARRMVRSGRGTELLPKKYTEWLYLTAARYLSLYAGKGPEEIFTYWKNGSTPTTLRKVKKPILVVLAEDDEYADRPAKEMAEWFVKNIKSPHDVVIVPHVQHSFRGAEQRVATRVRNFLKRF